MEFAIKQASLRDLDTLMEWRMEVLREVFAIPGGQEMTELEQQNRRYYETMLGSGGHVACFALLEQEIIGCGGICIYQEMPSPDNLSGQCAYLMNVYTRPQHRGQGAGERIVGWLTERALERGITKIYLETSEAGRSLYQKAGFSPMQDYLKLEIEKNDR